MEVVLAALIAQIFWFVIFVTFGTATARSERRQYRKRPRSRKTEYCGLLQSWIKRARNFITSAFWHTFSFKPYQKHV
jgi:hypothetical protein